MNDGTSMLIRSDLFILARRLEASKALGEVMAMNEYRRHAAECLIENERDESANAPNPRLCPESFAFSGSVLLDR